METKRRSVLKTISWRIAATFITGTLVWVLTGEAKFALTVGFMDTMIKLFVYFFHERLWLRIPYGQIKEQDYQI